MSNARLQNKLAFISLPPHEIKRTQELGRGAFGIVSAIKYTGNNPALIQLADQGELVLKEFQPIPTNETTNEKQEIIDNDTIISPYLYQMRQEIADLSKKCNLSVVIKSESENKLFLMSKRVVYDEGPPPLSGDLEKYIKKLHHNTGFQTTGYPGPDAFDNEHIANTLNELALSIKTAQNALHDAGVFHFDTAARNLLVNSTHPISVVITDFGVSEFIPENGIIDTDERRRVALKWVDQGSYQGRHTIATDLYALRMTLLETAVLSLGIPFNDVVTLPAQAGPSIKAFTEARMGMSDEEAMLTYLDNLKKIIEHPKHYSLDPTRCEQIQLFLDHYHDYLVYLPSGCKLSGDYSKAEIDAIRWEDNERLTEAHQLFASTLQKGSPYQNITINQNDIAETYQNLQNIRSSWMDLHHFITHLPVLPYTTTDEEKIAFIHLLSSLSDMEPLAHQHARLNHEKLNLTELSEIRDTIVDYYHHLILNETLPLIDRDSQELVYFYNQVTHHHRLSYPDKEEIMTIQNKIKGTGESFFPLWENLFNQYAAFQSSALHKKSLEEPPQPLARSKTVVENKEKSIKNTITDPLPKASKKAKADPIPQQIQNQSFVKKRAHSIKTSTKRILSKFAKFISHKKHRPPAPSILDTPDTSSVTHYRSILPPAEKTSYVAIPRYPSTKSHTPSSTTSPLSTEKRRLPK